MPATSDLQQSQAMQGPLLSVVRDIQTQPDPDAWNALAQCLVTLLRDYYVHLPMKVSVLGIDPVQQALLLVNDIPLLPSTAELHRRMFAITKALRDAHTAVLLPSPWRQMVAFLPFTVESCFDQNGRHLIVTKLLSDCGDPNFLPGVEITYWNGVAIGRYVESLSWFTEGANPYARIAIALRSLTVRPLGYMESPDEDWVNVTYTNGFTGSTVAIPWRVYLAQSGSTAAASTAVPTSSAAAVQGVNRSSLIVNGTWKDLFTTSGDAGAPATAPSVANTDSRVVNTSHGTFGYIRIFSFEEEDSAGFLQGFSALLRQMPTTGLIIDVRANPGGNIAAAEGLLSLFTERYVATQGVSFRATPATRKLSQVSDFQVWQRSLNLQLDTGDSFSQSFPLTMATTSGAGVYAGPIVVLIDALCYSATEFFAAGMQDNELATIIGMDPVTGAGGANVWTLSALSSVASGAGIADLAVSAGGYEIDLALRRSTRVGLNAGIPVEGIGVFADVTYQFTRRDVLSQNEDLIEFAGGVLAGMSR